MCGQIFYLVVFEMASYFGGGSKAMRSEYVEVENIDISNWPQALTTPLYLRPYFRGPQVQAFQYKQKHLVLWDIN